MGPVDPANLSHRSCFEVEHEPPGTADCTDDNTCFVCYEYFYLSISPPPFYSFSILFSIRPLPPVSHLRILEDVWTFKTWDGLRLRAPWGFRLPKAIFPATARVQPASAM
ncbi:hypothetical protein BJ912DRAFT_1040832 [Pholiota molesta]|nr:hypothetical protein BJ912DRAFT_1040832 [Pholiota molesta]